MSKKPYSYIIFLGIALILIVGIVLIADSKSSSSKTVSTNGNIPTQAAPGTKTGSGTSNLPTQTTYTLADVAKHNSASDCWTAVQDGVYDLTPFVDQHPGGRENILRICGIDGTSAFTDQHGGQRKPEQELAGLKIGMLSK